MDGRKNGPLAFTRQAVTAVFIQPEGLPVRHTVEIRTHPISGRTCRISFSRKDEREPSTETLPPPPPNANDRSRCPFCHPALNARTPRLPESLASEGRMIRGTSVLFPNLFPYGAYSAVSLFDDHHYVPIGEASTSAYTDSLINCRNYLRKVLATDPSAVYTAITQNHLPSAGGSLLHPHLQVHADSVGSNHHRFYHARAAQHGKAWDSGLFSDYLRLEKENGERTIGKTGNWQWLSSFAPEGFYEIWGILPGVCSLRELSSEDCRQLARGIGNAQRFFRSMNRNGYNLGMMAVESPESALELRAVLMVRSNYAAWARNDHTGYEVMLGEMATFSPPEETAQQARPFWQGGQNNGASDP